MNTDNDDELACGCGESDKIDGVLSISTFKTLYESSEDERESDRRRKRHRADEDKKKLLSRSLCEVAVVTSRGLKRSHSSDRLNRSIDSTRSSSLVDIELFEFFKRKSAEWSRISMNLIDTHCHLEILFNRFVII